MDLVRGVGDALHARAYNGTDSRWYNAALNQRAGRIIAGGLTIEVGFEPVERSQKDVIDDAYRAKYRESPYLKPMISNRASAATVRIMPRDTTGSLGKGG